MATSIIRYPRHLSISDTISSIKLNMIAVDIFLVILEANFNASKHIINIYSVTTTFLQIRLASTLF